MLKEIGAIALYTGDVNLIEALAQADGPKGLSLHAHQSLEAGRYRLRRLFS